MYAYQTESITAAFTMDCSKNVRLQEARSHQISCTKNGGSAGTLAVEVKPLASDRFEPLTVNGAAVTIYMASDVTFGPFDGLFSAIRVTPTGFNGTDFKLSFAGV